MKIRWLLVSWKKKIQLPKVKRWRSKAWGSMAVKWLPLSQIICIHLSILPGLNQNYRDWSHLCHRCPPSGCGTTALAAALPTTTPDSIHVLMRTTQRFIDFTKKIISFISLELTGNRFRLEKIWYIRAMSHSLSIYLWWLALIRLTKYIN